MQSLFASTNTYTHIFAVNWTRYCFYIWVNLRSSCEVCKIIFTQNYVLLVLENIFFDKHTLWTNQDIPEIPPEHHSPLLKSWIFTMWQCVLCHVMTCFEQNFHTQISGWDSALSATFCGDHIVDTMFQFHDHYEITISNDVARDVHCDIIMGHDTIMGAYHVIIHTDFC